MDIYFGSEQTIFIIKSDLLETTMKFHLWIPLSNNLSEKRNLG